MAIITEIRKFRTLPYSTQGESIAQETPWINTNKRGISTIKLSQYNPLRKYRMQTEIGNAHELKKHPRLEAALRRFTMKDRVEHHHSFLVNFFNLHRDKFTSPEHNEITYWFLKIMKIESIQRPQALAIALFSVKNIDSGQIQALIPRISINWVKLFAQKYGLLIHEFNSKWISRLDTFIHKLPSSEIDIYLFISTHINQTYLLKYNYPLRLALLITVLFPSLHRKDLYKLVDISISNYYHALHSFLKSDYYFYLQKNILKGN